MSRLIAGGAASESVMSPGETGRIHAVLIPDGGLSASSENFFRCPMYLAAEGVTHTLLLNANGMARAAAPIIVRPIPGGQVLWTRFPPMATLASQSKGASN